MGAVPSIHHGMACPDEADAHAASASGLCLRRVASPLPPSAHLPGSAMVRVLTSAYTPDMITTGTPEACVHMHTHAQQRRGKLAPSTHVTNNSRTL